MLKNFFYLPVVVAVIVSLSMVVVIDYQRAKQLLRTSLVENQILLAREVSSLINASITKSKETAHVYANIPLVHRMLANNDPQSESAKQELSAIINASVRLREDIDNIVLFESDGETYLAASGLTSNIATRSYFQRAMSGQSTIDSVISMTTGKRLLFYVTPIYSDNNIIGAAYISFNVASLNGIWSSFLTQNKDYKIRLVSEDGTILLSSVPSENGSMNIAERPSSVVLHAPQESPVGFEDDGERIGLWIPIGGTDWRILVTLDRGLSLAPVNVLLRDSIVLNIIAGLLVLGVVFFLLQKLTRQVRNVEIRSRDDLLRAKEELEELVRLRTEALNAQNLDLNLQRESLARMLQTCPVGISVVTAEGKMLYMNSELGSIFQCSVEGDPRKLYVYHEDRERIGIMLRQGLAVRNVETPMFDTTGKSLYILVSASLIHYEGQEAELRWFFNTTSEYESTIALERERTLLRSVLDAIPDIVFYKSTEGVYLSANTAFMAFMGKSSEDIIGKTDADFMADFPETYASCVAGDRRALDEKCIIHVEELARTASGDEVLLETVKTACIDDQGQAIGVLGVSRNITERKRMEREIIQAREEAQAASRAKSDFIANMSHEIRTPMNGIMGLAYLALQNPLLPPELKEYISKIDSSARSLLRIINDILDFSKIEAGKMEIEHIPFDLTELLANTIQPVIPVIEDKQLEMLFDFSGDIPTDLIGDSTRLGQIILNLVNNAVKFTKKGHILVRIEALNTTQTETLLQFTVSDTGIGIDPGYLSRLFEAFTQADTSVTRRYGGTGLGLTICKRLISLMGGEITVVSAPDQGANFIFTLPFGLSPSESQAVEDDLTDATILVVDDHELSRHILRACLQGYGARVEEASSGKDALQLFAARQENGTPYAAVLADWRMPGMDGLELTTQLRQLSQDRHLPVIMVTAYDRERILGHAREVGVNCVLNKPVTPSSLREALLHALREEHTVAAQRDEPVVNVQTVPGPLTGKRILLAEDNDINQLIAVELLSRFGMDVTVAENGLVAINLAFSQTFDAILMDIQMPELDGIGATRRIRKNPALKALPIIAMTAHAMSGDYEKSLQAGMQDHITKPINPEELYATLTRWVGGDGTSDMTD